MFETTTKSTQSHDDEEDWSNHEDSEWNEDDLDISDETYVNQQIVSGTAESKNMDYSWTCKSCSYINYYLSISCEQCLKSNEVLNEAMNIINLDKWTCKVCTYINFDRNKPCHMCQKTSHSETWMCHLCTYVNNDPKLACEMCLQGTHLGAEIVKLLEKQITDNPELLDVIQASSVGENINYKYKLPKIRKHKLKPISHASKMTQSKRPPQSSTPTDQLPQSITPTNQLPQSSTPTDQLPQSITPTNQLPQSITPTNQLPQSSTTTDQLPQSSTPTNQLPQSSTTTDQLPQSITSTDQLTQNIVENELRKPDHLPHVESIIADQMWVCSTCPYINHDLNKVCQKCKINTYKS